MTDIDREHPDYKRRKQVLSMYRDLYVGGQQFKLKAADYLLRRQKEPLDVYGERLQRAFYQNYIGSIVDWYAATLFRRAPSLQFSGGLESGQKFLTEFADDCDRRGTTLAHFFRGLLIDALVAGESHILVDFPRSAGMSTNRAEEDAAGLSRAYAVRYQAEDLINWSTNECGDYDWVVLRQSVRRQPTVDSPDIVKETYWFYYDRQEYRTYRRTDDEDEPTGIQLIARGPHCLVRQQRVPLLTLRLTEGLWLLNKAAHLQLEHFNKSNALGWAITMGLFAMPVIYSDRDWNQIVGESYYVQLGPQDKFGWTEPDGKVYQIAATNLETLKEEIYRVCYLSQASGEVTGGHAQSAASKQLDFIVTEEVLRAYASTIKDCIRKTLTTVSDAREDGVNVSVSGLDEVDIAEFGQDLQDASRLLQLGINSPTLKKQVFERLAFKYLNDARQETKDRIAHEIGDQLSSTN
jgi:hypothetical protein